MKKYPFYLLLILLLASCEKPSILLLHQQLASQTNERINEIYFVNDSLGFAVGGERYINGFVMRTTDAGNTWSIQNEISNVTLFGVHFLNVSVGEAVGYGGKVARTEDGGDNWTVLQYPTYERLNSVALIEADKTIIAAGDGFGNGFALNSSDNWWQFTRQDFIPSWLHVEMVNNELGFMAGYGAIAKTENAGETWVFQEIKGDFYGDLCFPNNEIIYACGVQGSIVKSEDGGTTWTKQLRVNGVFGKRIHLESIDFVDTKTGLAVGHDGLILITRNGGENWEKVDEFTSVNLRNVHFVNETEAIIGGDSGELWKVQI